VNTAEKNVRHTRATAWLTLILATATSLAGNVYHALHQPGSGKASVVAAVAVPIFLLLGIHLIGGLARARADGRTVSGVYRTALTAVGLLVVLVFAASFIALRDVLVIEGAPTWIAVIVPVAVDLAIGTATLALFALKPAAEPVAEPRTAPSAPREPVHNPEPPRPAAAPAAAPRTATPDTATRYREPVTAGTATPATADRGYTATPTAEYTATRYREPAYTEVSRYADTATAAREPVTAATEDYTATPVTAGYTATAAPATTAEYTATRDTATRFPEVRYSAPTATEPATTDTANATTEYTATTAEYTATPATEYRDTAAPVTTATATPATEYRDTAAPVTTATATPATPAADTGHSDRAAQLVADGKTKQSVDVVAAILAADAEGTALNSIAKQVGKHHSTVRAVLDAALTAV
jgi:hypothetical protein